MAGKETEITNQIKLAAAAKGWVLMRNNRGNFRTIDGKRIVQAGLSANGSSDLIGWQSVIITQEMVGQKVAVFTAVEVKADTKLSKEQAHFLDVLNKAGGIGIVAYGAGDV